MTVKVRDSLLMTRIATQVLELLLEQGELTLSEVVDRTNASPAGAHGILKAGVALGVLRFKPNETDGRQVGTYSVVEEHRYRIAEAAQASNAAYVAQAQPWPLRRRRLRLPRLFAAPPASPVNPGF